MYGVRMIIGKGGMSAATHAACERHGCVYLQAVVGMDTLGRNLFNEVSQASRFELQRLIGV